MIVYLVGMPGAGKTVTAASITVNAGANAKRRVELNGVSERERAMLPPVCNYESARIGA